ncbi:6939_t:CDS:2 [Paraglomus brasilianum]|uniref:6939_t:CDS:1 n=1 Tax=Paraglomus brasilianum TaxID=144538 RepID=A0A9N9GH93_9GLOM|nr:6939_t:CDS:2 [Paraglomus brasilianum]
MESNIGIESNTNHELREYSHDDRERPPNEIWFYNRGEAYFELSNFAEGFPILAYLPISSTNKAMIDSTCQDKWPTSEHLFQAMKFRETRPDIAEKIRHCSSARDALNLSRLHPEFIDPTWHETKLEVMEWVVKQKFTQHKVLADILLATGDKILVEHTQFDKFWGDGGNGQGNNHLGKVLMRVRSSIREARM